ALPLDVALVEVHVGSELLDLSHLRPRHRRAFQERDRRNRRHPAPHGDSLLFRRLPMIVALDSRARLFHDAGPLKRLVVVCLPAMLVSPVHAQPPDTGTLIVEVRSEGRPLAGATVSAGALKGTTDAAGRAA